MRHLHIYSNTNSCVLEPVVNKVTITSAVCLDLHNASVDIEDKEKKKKCIIYYYKHRDVCVFGTLVSTAHM